MTQPYGSNQYPPAQWPPSEGKPKPKRMKAVDEDEEPFSLISWRWIGMIIVGAIEAFGGAFFASWVVGLLHRWWPAIPLLPWQIALYIGLLVTGWSLFKDAVKSVGKKVGGPLYKGTKDKKA